jgi:hypothetical protein
MVTTSWYYCKTRQFSIENKLLEIGGCGLYPAAAFSQPKNLTKLVEVGGCGLYPAARQHSW